MRERERERERERVVVKKLSKAHTKLKESNDHELKQSEPKSHPKAPSGQNMR